MREPSSRLDPDRERRLGEAVAAYFAAIEAGRPSERAAILAAYPDLAADLAEFFDHEERLGRLVGPIRSTEPDVGETGGETTPLEFGSTTEGSEAAPNPPPLGESTLAGPEEHGAGDADPLARGLRVRYFGDYQLSTVLGRGGMGIVYKANQLSLNRVVAVKMIRSGHWADEEEVRRFRNEAEAVANLDHPLILPIYEVGRYEDQHYFSMKLVPGGSLENRLGELRADVRTTARLVADVARAVHHAHQRGLLHRDLKPSNILLDPEGRPHVADFGLAKRIEGDGAASVSGAIVGTPSYMSPEQATGRRSSVTTATDVYGLGALLYACLTGRPPFKGDDVVATLRMVTDQPPEPPSKSNPRLDRDLETICLRCLEKDPKRRYDSASALADDLERWLRGEPILARRSGTWERIRKWSRRHPARAALVAMSGVAALTLVGLGVALFIHSQLRSAYDEVDRQRGISEAALASERTFLYQNRVIFAERELNDNSISAAEQLLDECPEGLRGWEWHYLKRRCHLELMSLPGHVGAVWAVATSPDGHWIASGGEDKTIRVWDARTGKPVWKLEGHGEPVYSVAFSPDGGRLASAGGTFNGSDRLLVHEVETGRTLLNQPLDLGYGCTVGYSPNGRSLVVASGGRSANGWVRVLDAETGRVQKSMPVETNMARSTTFSPDGTRLLAVLGIANIADPVFRPNQVVIWNLASGQIELRLEGHTSPVMDAVFSPDGCRVAATGYDATVRIWDSAKGGLLRSCRGHRGCINNLAFSPDGRRLASGCDDNSAKVWDVETGEELLHLRGHKRPVWGVAFTPDGQRLATAGTEGEVKVFDVTNSSETVTIAAHQTRANGVLFSPDGKWLVTYGMDRSLKVWDLSTGRIRADWTEHTDPIWCAVFSPDGRFLASAAGDWSRDDRLGEIIVRESVTGKVKYTLKAHRGIAWTVAFSPDGRLLATGGGEYRTPNQQVILWDVATGGEVRRFSDLPGGVTSVVFTPDGRRIIASSGKAILGWEVETGRSYGAFAGHKGVINQLAISPDGHWLVSSSDDDASKVWDAATGNLVRNLTGPTYRAATISRDGGRIAAASIDDTVRVWDFDTSESLVTLWGHHTFVWGVAFSPDGRLIASCDQNGMVKLWDGSPAEGGVR